MPNYQISQYKAIQQYQLAQHLLKVTYPLVNDPRLLIEVIHKLFSVLENSLDALLAYEAEHKLIEVPSKKWEEKLQTLRQDSPSRNKVPSQFFVLSGAFKEILDWHKSTPMEFQRGNRLVICCGKDYRQLKYLSLKDLQDYLNQTKICLEVMNSLLH